MEIHEFQLRARLDGDALQAWIEARWLMPSRIAGRPEFSEVDLARAQLIAHKNVDRVLGAMTAPLLVDEIPRNQPLSLRQMSGVRPWGRTS